MKHDFGLIAIGDEITDGDIVNTNTQRFAMTLSDIGFNIGIHICCRDISEDISSCIDFLIKEHSNIITIGGLGPTEDDVTSESIATHFEKKLILDDKSWIKLEQRSMLKYGRIIAGTKKQALFPDTSHIIINENGSANGFKLEFTDNRFIYTFPGPPNECIPMITNMDIKKTNPTKNIIRQRWFVTNIGESLLAEKLEIIKKEYTFVTFKYRATKDNIELKYFYPYNCPHSKNIIINVELILKEYL